MENGPGWLLVLLSITFEGSLKVAGDRVLDLAREHVRAFIAHHRRFLLNPCVRCGSIPQLYDDAEFAVSVLCVCGAYLVEMDSLSAARAWNINNPVRYCRRCKQRLPEPGKGGTTSQT